MKKILIGVICLLLLGGCSTKQTATNTDELETFPYTAEQQVTAVSNITVYIYSEATSRLESRVVTVSIYPDQSKADAALSYLLSTPDFAFTLNSYGVPDYNLTVSGGIAKVNITNRYDHNSGDHFKCLALHFSIVNTLCSIEGINYVSVYADNTEMSGEAYIGPSQFLEKTLTEIHTELYGINGDERAENISSQKSMLLYYSEKNNKFIVPEHKQVYANTSNEKATINAMLEQLSKQPVNSSDLMSPIAKGVGINTIKTANNTMTIDFTADPCPDTIENKDVCYSSLYHSIIGVYPSIRSLSFTINGEDSGYQNVDKDTFSSSVGNAVTMYMTTIANNALYPVNRYISASASISASDIMETLMAGPGSHDGDDMTSPIFGELSYDNLISAKVVNDLAIINFDNSFYETVKSLDKTHESIMVYAIVNTLTSREQINRVQFLINNQKFETITGHINYSNPLISNPGIISK